MRRRLPRCPFCCGRMIPQAKGPDSFAYVCENPDCQAASPVARSYGEALDKADNRSAFSLAWLDRKHFEPMVSGEYMCEYVFRMTDDKVSRVFHGVRRWDADERKFDFEMSDTLFGDEVMILRWADFSGSLEKGCAATQEANAV